MRGRCDFRQLSVERVTIALDGKLAYLGLGWCTILAGAVWSSRHPSFRIIAAPLEALAQLIPVSIVCALLQYAAARTGRPLVDAELADFDHALYFDWPACFAWVLKHPTVLTLLSWVYLSLGLQSVLVCLLALRHPGRAGIILAANALTLTFCIVVFVAWPAGGAFVYYDPPGIVSEYVEQFIAARASLLTSLSVGQLKGIIQFPSYHAAGAVLLAYAFTSLPRGIAIPALVIEITMVVSAVPIGGHHLVDVFAGVAVAALSLAITLGLERIGQRNRVKLVPKALGLVRA